MSSGELFALLDRAQNGDDAACEQVLQEIEAAKKLSPNDFRIYAFEQIKDTF